jgi:hypothetical protein
MLIKRALKGDLPLIPAAERLRDEIMGPPAGLTGASDEPLGEERRLVGGMKKVALLVAGSAMERYGAKLDQEQEVVSAIADIAIEAYASESAVLRALDAATRSLSNASLHIDAATTYVHEAAGRAELSARYALAAMLEGDALRTMLAALRRLLKATPANTVVMRRRLADVTVARGGYVFDVI